MPIGVQHLKTYLAAIFIIGAICQSSVGMAQTSVTEPLRASGYDRLSPLVGHWTIKGREETHLEVCRWYDGKFHIICETERKRPDGSIGRSMSILSYLPDKDSYAYYGIGDKGGNDAMSGVFHDGILEFTAEADDNGETIVSRVRIGPFSATDVPFVAETSNHRVTWKTDASFDYVRLE